MAKKPIEDIRVSPHVEQGAISLYASSPPFLGRDMTKELLWRLLTPAIRNRWRIRFLGAFAAAMKVYYVNP